MTPRQVETTRLTDNNNIHLSCYVHVHATQFAKFKICQYVMGSESPNLMHANFPRYTVHPNDHILLSICHIGIKKAECEFKMVY